VRSRCSAQFAPFVYVLAPMRVSLNVVGLLCLVVGCVWFLQGINILPGSFMTGQTQWAIYGAILFVVGIGLLIRANRRRV
jgi:hypothetical protein